jgi:hypothetical protein
VELRRAALAVRVVVDQVAVDREVAVDLADLAGVV